MADQCEDEMSDLQNALLKRLNEYGQSVLDGDYDKRKKYVRPKSQRNPEGKDWFSTQALTPDSEMKAKKKRKKRQKKLEESNADSVNTNTSVDMSKMNKHEREVMLWKRELNINTNTSVGVRQGNSLEVDSKKTRKEEQSEKLDLCTVGYNDLKRTGSDGPEVIFYHTPGKRKKVNPQTKDSDTTIDVPDSQTEFNLKKARYDVRKLGIKGMVEKEKEEAMVSLLCSLGAKPPKKKFYNYKEFQERRKQEIEDSKQQKQINRSLGLKTGSKKKRRPRDKNDVGNMDGQVGKYRKGIQIVRKQEIRGLRK